MRLGTALGVLLGIATPALADAPLTLPLTADKIMRYVEQENVRSLDELLMALPMSLRENFALAHTSGSLQQSSYEKPRVVLFGSDARFLAGVSGTPEDPRYNHLEFAELDPSTNRYDFGTIDFGGERPTLSRDDTVCRACHGAEPHPLWGEYPSWLGFYGNEGGGIAEEDMAGFKAFRAQAASNPRYEFLRYEFLEQNDYLFFLLSNRSYGVPNTAIGFNLASTMSVATFERLKQLPRYRELRFALAGLNVGSNFGPTFTCRGTPSGDRITERVDALYAAALRDDPTFATEYADRPTYSSLIKIYRLIGFDATAELNLSPTSAIKDSYEQLWYAGSGMLSEFIGVQVLVDVASEVPSLARALATNGAAQEVVRHLRLNGDERTAALATESDYPAWYALDRALGSIFFPANGERAVLGEVCTELAARAP